MANTNAILKNEQIHSQIGVSISLARNVVSSWLPPLTDEEKAIEAKQSQQKTGDVLAKRRAPRAGLGSTGEKDESSDLTIEEMKIKRKLIQKEKRLNEQSKEDALRKNAKRYLNASPTNSEDEEEGSIRRKGQKQLKKNAHSPFLSIKEKKSPNNLRKGFGR
ncbi:protein of unknown function [Taphrina deformans PYCC 5710]|uniref:Uncharacterized protein n=1 Tax=Taphrina deformans (strain PYCC 5710 / ATCC 11124 / CBS 356.35 / IMI 108563 / JCM 9778 / NBRC 8474) TaxID=1097556 RepID=R4XDD8_TAPDE|nr:protein of unknown function [Taphrina deformans PYCC 5710]|eukprot:CCG83845.1 protein of unknown function [Taphrina deformans PYCC 5710]